jgi:hypothetical protein
MNFKQLTPRDPAYLKWIRTQPCVLCGPRINIDAHHTESGGTGIKGSDYSCVPLCPACHFYIHSLGRKNAIPNLRDVITRLRGLYDARNDKQKKESK